MTSTDAYALAPLLLAFPVAGAAVLLLGGRRTDPIGHVVGVLASAGAFVVAVVTWLQMLARDPAQRPHVQRLWTFVDTGRFHVDMGLQLDQLSVVFALLITGVGTLIHVYSVAYMGHDRNRRRFFAYMNLFVAAMLLLVLASDYLLVYVGWEGVGLASYLLIGFWSHNPAYATAAKKAFVANRVGDMGMSIGIILIFTTFGATDFARVLPLAGEASHTRLTLIGLLFLLAACGKSAQLPLQSWLGDAMAGPTPVSALIHAATMVTAGVYLIVRSGPIYDGSSGARLAVTIVGAATLLFGALIGTAKDDIKKALAASTMSQIGYMVLAAGLGPAGYAIAIFHLLTHGFFKAGLFLGAGSVMHAMGDRTDMRRFGGLWRVLPVTFVTFGLGYLAIIGFPGLSGFWSKDKIIEAAFDKGGTSGMILGIVALLGAGITSFYMTRVMVMTFFGPRRWEDDVHPHEAPTLMTGPMVLLAVGSTFLGAILAFGGMLQDWLAPAVGRSAEVGVHTVSPLVLTLLTLLVVVGGAAGAFWQYAAREVPVVAPVGSPATVAARRDLYQDALNEALLMRPGEWLSRLLVFGDNRGIDAVVNGLAAAFGGTSSRLRPLQSGFVRSYALSFLGGAILVAGALLVVTS